MSPRREATPGLRQLPVAAAGQPPGVSDAERRHATPADHLREDEGRRDIEFISIPEWCRRLGCAPDSGYRAARRDEIPGLFRIGRLVRVNWPAFVEATFPANPQPRHSVKLR